MPMRPVVIVFAATDGSGGAGLLADCRVLHAGGCLPLAVVTAVTAQNLDGVAACWRLPPARARAQYRALVAVRARAVKIGVVGAAGAVAAECAFAQKGAAVVWDPVLAPTVGNPFATAADIAILRRRLLPHVDVLTPNREEALRLAGERRAAAAVGGLLRLGVAHVLVTDWEGRGKTIRKALFGGAGKTPLWEAETPRREGKYHGSGCFFSAALTARLALGDDIGQAAASAHEATTAAIRRAFALPALGEQRLLP